MLQQQKQQQYICWAVSPPNPHFHKKNTTTNVYTMYMFSKAQFLYVYWYDDMRGDKICEIL